VLADVRAMPPPPLGRGQAKWAAAYTHDVFTGGIQSTQRNEGMNACLKGHLTGSTPLDELVDALDMVMLKHGQRVAGQRYERATQSPPLRTASPAEAAAWSQRARDAAARVATARAAWSRCGMPRPRRALECTCRLAVYKGLPPCRPIVRAGQAIHQLGLDLRLVAARWRPPRRTSASWPPR
jgi:hypothetical protein